jgi:hypothetical protein
LRGNDTVACLPIAYEKPVLEKNEIALDETTKPYLLPPVIIAVVIAAGVVAWIYDVVVLKREFTHSSRAGDGSAMGPSMVILPPTRQAIPV